MTAAVTPRADLPALTGIRGIAAWFVVLYHIRSGAGGQIPAELMAVLERGYLAVDLFFMLSGFVLWLNYGERMRSEGWAAVPHFIGRRIARIWPLHLFMLAIAAAFALLLAARGTPNPGQYPWSELPLHILLLQNWGFTSALSWNDPAWSISCEFFAYLAFPLLALHIDWRRLAPETLILLITLLCAALYLLMDVAGATRLDDQITRLGLLRAIVQFVIGTLVCGLWQHWRSGNRGAFAMLPALYILFLAIPVPEMTEPGIAPALLAGLLLVVAIGADNRFNPLGWRPIHYLGEISYSTYLVHFLGFKFFKIAFAEDALAIPLELLGLFLLMTLAASILLYHGVERPAQRARNRAFDRAVRRFRPPPPLQPAE